MATLRSERFGDYKQDAHYGAAVDRKGNSQSPMGNGDVGSLPPVQPCWRSPYLLQCH